jgi:hypothetical protein
MQFTLLGLNFTKHKHTTLVDHSHGGNRFHGIHVFSKIELGVFQFSFVNL